MRGFVASLLDSPLEEKGFEVAVPDLQKVGALGERGQRRQALSKVSRAGGTGGSNPVPSSGESCANHAGSLARTLCVTLSAMS
jgi:hypothetical protein